MSDDRLRQLCDTGEITRVLNEYCSALDRMDLPRLCALFTEDCLVEYGPEDWLRSRGAADLERSLARMWRWARTSHHLSNIQIEFEGDGDALARSYVQAWHQRPDGTTATVYGRYQDRFVRLPAGWRIAERRMFMNGSDSGFAVNIARSERKPPPEGWQPPPEAAGR